MTTTEKLTQEQLAALPDEELNALAATRVMGWKKREETYRIFDVESGILRDWVDPDGKCQSAVCDWSPTADRNQSGGLLAKMAERGGEFTADYGGEDRVTWMDRRGFWNKVPGNSARAETIAAILAAQALEERND